MQTNRTNDLGIFIKKY